jgi:hypothetical protein
MPYLHHPDKPKGSIKARTKIKRARDLGPKTFAALTHPKNHRHAQFELQERLPAVFNHSLVINEACVNICLCMISRVVDTEFVI